MYVVYSTHTHTHNVVLSTGFSVCYFGIYVKSHGVYLSLYLLVFVMWMPTLLTVHFSFLLVCALHILYPFVFKHVYIWLPYASAAVGNSFANSVSGFACYFTGDHTFSHMRYWWPGRKLRISISHPCRKQFCRGESYCHHRSNYHQATTLQPTDHPCLSLITSGRRWSGCSHWSVNTTCILSATIDLTIQRLH